MPKWVSPNAQGNQLHAALNCGPIGPPVAEISNITYLLIGGEGLPLELIVGRKARG
jgi:hypothetical protein